jgi:hypothetical protein
MIRDDFVQYQNKFFLNKRERHYQGSLRVSEHFLKRLLKYGYNMWDLGTGVLDILSNYSSFKVINKNDAENYVYPAVRT